eukprot:GDKI01000455.1.p3 GENE.GDKI01000455.1~~GDKI01000455.1.p3  ORF type:complete len:114 (-),score=41.44 GDKI01000455.1:196-537(-)
MCPDGTEWRDGKCLHTEATGVTYTCPHGWSEGSAKGCVKRETVKPKLSCPSTGHQYIMKDGVCVRDVWAPFVYVCDKGQQLVGEECVMQTKTTHTQTVRGDGNTRAHRNLRGA